MDWNWGLFFVGMAIPPVILLVRCVIKKAQYRQCDWCKIYMSGVRRYFRDACRDCAPHYGDAGIYLQSGMPPFHHREREGMFEK